ncbi:hypothetical protein [uncultured Methanolobus sp.]|uniref:hypothetical protein n=1 Tax=uncultured Methanolobus sp. TaxID=218300 RepID=UPI002AAAAC86|nr:hypothetical protein [uncultured Methanolobus sp.]
MTNAAGILEDHHGHTLISRKSKGSVYLKCCTCGITLCDEINITDAHVVTYVTKSGVLEQLDNLDITDEEYGYLLTAYYSGKIEFPGGHKSLILVERNETGRFTILLPEDH